MSALFRTLVFTVIAPGFWTVALPYWVLPVGSGIAPGARRIGALVLFIGGAVLYVICAFWAFALVGGATPAPFDAPKKLVVRGPYRVVRNPMYWSVALIMFAEALSFRSRVLVEWAILFFSSSVIFVLLYEQPHLRRVFGAEYEEYCRRVPGWIPCWLMFRRIVP